MHSVDDGEERGRRDTARLDLAEGLRGHPDRRGHRGHAPWPARRAQDLAESPASLVVLRGQGHAHHDRDTNTGITIPLRGAAMIELKSPAEIERMEVTGRFVGELLAELGERAAVGVNLLDLEHHARRLIQRTRRRVLLLGLRPVVRPRPVPQRALPVGQRRGAARPAARLRAARRRPAQHRHGGRHRRLGRRLRALRHRRHPRPGGPEADRGHRGRAGGRDRRRPARRPPRRHLRRDRRGRPRLRLPRQRRVRRPRHRPHHARGPARRQQRHAPAAACACDRASPSPSSPGSPAPPTRSSTTPTAGRSARPTARAPPTPSTPSPSPRTAPWS